MFKSFRRIAPLLLWLLMAACASKPALQGNPEIPYPPVRSPQVGDILHLPTGYYVTSEQMMRTVTDSRIVYVGETHDNPASHRLQLEVLAALSERYPGRVAMGMEMFTPAQQQILDRWTAGELTEKEFLQQSKWFDVWKMDFELYRELLLFAREHAIPVIGLNAEEGTVRELRQASPEELSDKVRAQVPDLDMEDPYQRAVAEAIFTQHPAHGEKDVEGLLRVQTLWDETMAQNVADYLARHPDAHMLVVAGGNHVRYGYGIPRRAFRRLPVSYSLLGSEAIEFPADFRGKLMDVEPPPLPMPPYHFVTFTRYEAAPERVRMGVLLGEGEEGVAVEGVVPGSAAEKAGIRKSDLVVAFDGAPVREPFDLIYAVRQKQAGDTVRVEILRDGQLQTVEITFAAPGESTHGK